MTALCSVSFARGHTLEADLSAYDRVTRARGRHMVVTWSSRDLTVVMRYVVVTYSCSYLLFFDSIRDLLITKNILLCLFTVIYSFTPA